MTAKYDVTAINVQNEDWQLLQSFLPLIAH